MSRAKCVKCGERPWTKIVEGKGLCGPCLGEHSRRKDLRMRRKRERADGTPYPSLNA